MTSTAVRRPTPPGRRGAAGPGRPRGAGLPFGHRWHLEISDGTYLLLDLPPHGPQVVEIDVLALGRDWDTGVLLNADEARRLLAALRGPTPAQTAGWILEHGWLTLCGHPVVCQLELTPFLRNALIGRLQAVLAGLQA